MLLHVIVMPAWSPAPAGATQFSARSTGRSVASPDSIVLPVIKSEELLAVL